MEQSPATHGSAPVEENYRGFTLIYRVEAQGPPTGGYIADVSASPPTSRGQVPQMGVKHLIAASSDEHALELAATEARSLVDDIAPHIFTNEDLASHQLERALILFFEEGDYLSALTLSHAAYNIFLASGKPADQPNAREKLADLIAEVASRHEKKVTREEVIRRMNAPANALKHPDGDGREKGTPFQGSIVEMATDCLDFAVEEAFRVLQNETSGMRRFREWHMKVSG